MRLGQHQRDRLADIPDDAVGEARLGDRRDRPWREVEVGRGVDGHDAGRVECRRGVDRRNPGVRDRAADERRVQGTGKRFLTQILDVRAALSDQLLVLDPHYPGADDAHPASSASPTILPFLGRESHAG